MADTMTAVVKTEPVPAATEVKRIARPTIRPDEALVRVAIASICGTDLHIYDWDAWSQGRIRPPLVQGHEMAGVVERIGEDVTTVVPGDAVSFEGHIACGRCYECRTGQAHVCRNVRIMGIDRDGAFAEYVAVPGSNLMKNDPSLPLEVATIQDPLGNAVQTVMNANVPGKAIAIFGLGPIGLMAVGIAKALSAAKIIGVEKGNEYRKGLAKTLGAHEVLESDGGTLDRILELTDGEGVHEALEFSGAAAALAQATKAVRPGGGVHLLGLFNGPVSVDLTNDVIMRGVTLHGITGRRMFRTWYEMAGILKSGNVDLRPLVTHRFPLSDYERAMDVVRSRQCGKVVLQGEGTT
ncbi:MAG: L-threonine 3-dehydrogenase [Euryarchaeota archaeon RBG_16_68_13]|nr:MAG: L-threonine 3-dehydrogenase [Euryarchaeota archaeon RBG_16_68_13]